VPVNSFDTQRRDERMKGVNSFDTQRRDERRGGKLNDKKIL